MGSHILCSSRNQALRNNEEVPDWGLAGLELYEVCGFVLSLGQDLARLEKLLDGPARRPRLRHFWLVWVRPVLEELKGRFCPF